MTQARIGFVQAAQSLRHFRLIHIRFVLRAETDIQLPPYKGSAFRGGFGHALKRFACAATEACDAACLAPDRCVYLYLFETKLQTDGPGEQAIPRPFVLIPPIELFEAYAPGDLMTCHLVLAGEAIDYLPYFIAGLQELGQMGIGRDRGRFSLTQVQVLPPDAPAYDLYAASEPGVAELRSVATVAQLLAPYEGVSARRVTLEFLTPTRLKHQGRLIKQTPPFHVIMRRLLDRIAELSLFFHDTPLTLDLKTWKRQSEQIQAQASRVSHYDWERYSNRQRVRMKLGGVVGAATYTGDLTPFMPLLALGEWLHVGKGATFGLGKYRIVDVE